MLANPEMKVAAAAVVGFEITTSLLVTLGASALALVVVVGICQWL